MSTKLTGKEIVAIIRACRECSVFEIHVADVRILFGQPEHVTHELPRPQTESDSTPPKNVAAEITQHHIENLMISDPQAFEKGVANGDYQP